MPKIRTNQFIRIGNGEGPRDYHHFDIHYSPTAQIFYTPIPLWTKPNFDALKNMEEDRRPKEFTIAVVENRRPQSKTAAIIGKSEKEVREGLNEYFKYVAGNETVERRVIIVEFETDTNQDSRTGSRLPEIQVKFELTFAIESKLKGRNQVIYYTENSYEGLDYEPTVYRNQVDFWGHHVVMDDTPENREFLIGTYDRFLEWSKKAAEFMSTKKSIQAMIDERFHLNLIDYKQETP